MTYPNESAVELSVESLFDGDEFLLDRFLESEAEYLNSFNILKFWLLTLCLRELSSIRKGADEVLKMDLNQSLVDQWFDAKPSGCDEFQASGLKELAGAIKAFCKAISEWRLALSDGNADEYPWYVYAQAMSFRGWASARLGIDIDYLQKAAIKGEAFEAGRKKGVYQTLKRRIHEELLINPAIKTEDLFKKLYKEGGEISGYEFDEGKVLMYESGGMVRTADLKVFRVRVAEVRKAMKRGDIPNNL